MGCEQGEVCVFSNNFLSGSIRTATTNLSLSILSKALSALNNLLWLQAAGVPHGHVQLQHEVQLPEQFYHDYVS